jgi:retron-type reverse transcriptase
MKVKDLFTLITSSETLFSAWEVFKSDKRNKPDILQFEKTLEQNIFDLHRELKTGAYQHGSYEGFWINDPKRRRIHKALVRDRVLHHALFRVLNPIFEPTFIPASFSCRVGKGTHKGVEYLAKSLRSVSRNNTRPCFVLKCDVRKFFDSVDQKVLYGILNRKIKDTDTLHLLTTIISSYSSGFNERERERVKMRGRVYR